MTTREHTTHTPDPTPTTAALDDENTTTRRAIVKYKNEGMSWDDIAQRFNITMREAYDHYVMYTRQKPRLTQDEQRVLQMDRLDALLEAVWSYVDTTSDVKGMAELLKILKEISVLAELNRTEAKQSITVIENHQVVVIANYVEAVTSTLREQVLRAMPGNSKRARERIENSWDEWVVDASAQPLQELTAPLLVDATPTTTTD